MKKKDSWVKIGKNFVEVVQENELDKESNISSQIVMCTYVKDNHQNVPEVIKQDLGVFKQSQDYFLIPKNFINKLRFLDQKSCFVVDLEFCKHDKLRPIYDDLYLKHKPFQIQDDIKNRDEFDVDAF